MEFTSKSTSDLGQVVSNEALPVDQANAGAAVCYGDSAQPAAASVLAPSKTETSDAAGTTGSSSHAHGQLPIQGHLALTKKTYLEKTREEVKVPAIVKNAVENFVVPEGYQREGTHDQGFIYSWGVYVKPKSRASKKKPEFFCLASSKCRRTEKMVPCTVSRSNVNKHLKLEHNYVGNISIRRAENAERVEGAAAHVLEKGQKLDTGRKRCG